MKMNGEIRVRTDRRHKELYKDLKECAMGDAHEVFFLCACLGYKMKARKPLGKTGDERFFSKNITIQEYSSYYSMMVKDYEYDYSSIQDDKKVLEVMEEYANAGMDILVSEFLSDYLLVKDAQEPRLEKAMCKELAKTLLFFTYSKSK